MKKSLLTWDLPFGILTRTEVGSKAPESLGARLFKDVEYTLLAKHSDVPVVIPRGYALALIHCHATEEVIR